MAAAPACDAEPDGLAEQQWRSNITEQSELSGCSENDSLSKPHFSDGAKRRQQLNSYDQASFDHSFGLERPLDKELLQRLDKLNQRLDLVARQVGGLVDTVGVRRGRATLVDLLWQCSCHRRPSEPRRRVRKLSEASSAHATWQQPDEGVVVQPPEASKPSLLCARGADRAALPAPTSITLCVEEPLADIPGQGRPARGTTLAVDPTEYMSLHSAASEYILPSGECVLPSGRRSWTRHAALPPPVTPMPSSALDGRALPSPRCSVTTLTSLAATCNTATLTSRDGNLSRAGSGGRLKVNVNGLETTQEGDNEHAESSTNSTQEAARLSSAWSLAGLSHLGRTTSWARSGRSTTRHNTLKSTAGSITPSISEDPRTEDAPRSSRRQKSQASVLNSIGMVRWRTKRTKTQQAVWKFFQDPESSRLAYGFSVFMPVLILLSVVVTILQTVEVGNRPFSRIVAQFIEVAFEVIFAIELVSRFSVCPNRCKFLKSWYNILDSLTVLPLAWRIWDLFAHDWGLEDDEFVDTVVYCIVPTVRLLKTLRYFPNSLLVLDAFQVAFEALPVLLFTLAVITFVFASLIFFCEDRYNIPTLPKAIWLTIVTMTTVGYGDVVPRSSAGAVVVGVLVICSVLYMAIPLGLLGHVFSQIWADRHHILLMQRAQDCLAQTGYTHDQARLFFRHFDADHSGEIEIHEFRQMIKEMNIGLDTRLINDLFVSFDLDKSNTISEIEFVRGLFPNTWHEVYNELVAEAAPLYESDSSWDLRLDPRLALADPLQALRNSERRLSEDSKPRLSVEPLTPRTPTTPRSGL